MSRAGRTPAPRGGLPDSAGTKPGKAAPASGRLSLRYLPQGWAPRVRAFAPPRRKTLSARETMQVTAATACMDMGVFGQPHTFKAMPRLHKFLLPLILNLRCVVRN